MINKNYYPIILASVIIIGSLLLGGLLYYHPKNSIQPASTFDVSPSHALSLKPSQSVEPVVTSWTTYENDQYHFSIDIPSGWNQQEYETLYTNGGLFIAFSPDVLPCKTCSYVHNGYFSIRIYNQKTYPEYYSQFLTRIKNAGRSTQNQQISLAGIPGVLSDGNTVAIENQGWVYELALDKDQGNAKITDSQVFQKIASSLKFTDLLFNK